MSDVKQIQKAGEGSTQYQANTIIVQNGIDEKRAHEIFAERFDILRKDLTEEAYETACRRVSEFENDLIPKMQKIEGALDAFGDPSFQFLITNAHRTAAATDRSEDYALLSELLIHRIQRREKRTTIAGIRRAVEIVDEISDEALLALSVSFAVAQYVPVSGDTFHGLDVLDNFFGKLCYGELPCNSEWLDHLDILNTIRISEFGGFKKLEDYYAEQMPGYCAVGIKKDSDNLTKAQQLLSDANLSDNLLVINELNPIYFRIPVVNEKRIDALSLEIQVNMGGKSVEAPVSLSDGQKNALHKIYALYDNDKDILKEIKAQFLTEILKRPNLKKVREWWNHIPSSFEITAVGKVLAHANAKRCDNSLPDLN